MQARKFKTYLFSCLSTLAVGGLSGLLIKDAIPAYERLAKPPLTPPSWVFPVVWNILYLLMGVSAAMIYRSNAPGRERALWVYEIQLAVNFFWSLLFFLLRAYLGSFLWLLLLWALIARMIALFGKISRPAALLQLPYLLWVTFAGYLNLMIWLLNR